MKKILLFLTILFATISTYSQILIDDGPIIINRKIGMTPDYVIQGNSWNHRILTYWFSNGTNDITGNEERIAIRSAMDIWQTQTNLRFFEVCDSVDADIIFMWTTGDHGDGYPFDGTGGTLAHAFFPPPNGDYAGDVHFDDDETWTTATRPNSDQPIDLITIAAHELGHSLGLAHSSVSSALMYAYYSGSHRYLHQDDINGIRSIYGNPGTYDFISGPTLFCSSDSFTLNDLPPVDSIIWIPGPYLSISSGQNTSSCTFTRSPVNSGSSWVSARLVNDCGSITLPQKEVYVGGGTVEYIMGPLQASTITANRYLIMTSSLSEPTSFDWFVTPSNSSVIYSYGSSADIEFNNPGDYLLTVWANNTCGSGSPYQQIITAYDSLLLRISPNPTTGETTLTIQSSSEKEILDVNREWDLEVYTQTQVLKAKKNRLKGSSTVINTSGWQEGVYVVRALYNNEIITGKLIVKR